MIEIDIPSIDPIQHEAKIFMGMTSRQCMCITPGALAGLGLFMLTYKISMDLAIILLAICVVPAVCFGWVSPYGMRLEKYLKLIYYNNFVHSPKRVYKTDNEVAEKRLTMKEREALEKKQKETKLNEKRKMLEKKNAKKSKERKGV